jgi:hypothetical protein
VLVRVLVLTALLLLACAAPAAAHPFGPPSTARADADGTTVTLSWTAAEDDWVALGQSLGAFDASTSLTGEEKLRRSPAVRDYLLDRITVSQAGRPCRGELAPLADLVTAGARFTFSCPQPVSDVDIRLGALTDLNEAYRTVLTADTATPDRALFTATQDTLRLRFSGGGSGVTASVVGVAAGTVVAAAGLLVLVRRRRRS